MLNKRIILFLTSIFIVANSYAQIKVIENKNVGIGIDVPTSKLHIKSNNSTGSTDAVKVENAVGISLLHIEDGGNVGIGTSNPSTDHRLDIRGGDIKLGNYISLGYGNNISNIRFGHEALITNTGGTENIAIGGSTLKSNVSGQKNVAIGISALSSNENASFNLAIGSNSLQNNVAGYNNIGIGYIAMKNNISGSGNIAVGTESLYNMTNLNYNTAIGMAAGKFVSGDNNTVLGYLACASCGTGNVAIGHMAGRSNGGANNRLFISNNNDTSPLIYGEFDNDIIKIHGKLSYLTQGGTSVANVGIDANGFLTTAGAATVHPWAENGLNIFRNTGGNVGIGTSTPSATLEVNGSISIPIKDVSSSYIITSQDHTILVSGNSTITLPSAIGIKGVLYIVKKVDSSSNTTTVQTFSSQTIDGNSSIQLTNQYEKIAIQSDGSNWYIIG